MQLNIVKIGENAAISQAVDETGLVYYWHKSCINSLTPHYWSILKPH
jgi:hypothetical protein